MYKKTQTITAQNKFLFLKKFLRQKAGFSAMELLVVMFIISLIAAAALAGYRNSQKKYILT